MLLYAVDLIDACRLGHANVITQYLQQNPICDVNRVQYGELLMQAVWYRQIHIACVLLDHGVSPNGNAKGNNTEVSPLLFSLQSSNLEMAQLLMERGADINNGHYAVKPLLYYKSFTNDMLLLAFRNPDIDFRYAYFKDLWEAFEQFVVDNDKNSYTAIRIIYFMHQREKTIFHTLCLDIMRTIQAYLLCIKYKHYRVESGKVVCKISA